MKNKHLLAGKTVKLNIKIKDYDIESGVHFRIEDWWENVNGKSWMLCDGNPACMIYGMRSGFAGLPTDDDVVYGKIGSAGHLIHISELGEEIIENQP